MGAGHRTPILRPASALALTPALALTLVLALASAAGRAAVTVRDDAGNSVTLAQPARRVISMAPHITELLFAAGGGARVVGAMNFSDYPEAAKRLPLVGSDAQIDMERVLALKPDLLVVWKSGNTARQLEQLKTLNIPIFYSEPQRLDDIATSVTRLGQLLGTDAAAQTAAADYRRKLAALSARYAHRPQLRVFYQIWSQPLYTLNGDHIVSAAISLCGGQNIFAGLKVVAPQVGIEAVLAENPEAIIGGESHEPSDPGVFLWRRYPSLLAVQRGDLFALGGDALSRATPRMADGIAQLCEKLETARQHRR
ncbi:cobalamin-binding protein [Rugamonas sp.]|uniref:cobalamin-binding protein n=1 Tax=Rugamonas sp. TaxID=1926287 RepID=UPI0025E43346|nr:cobalamin-binding protein [Rugamonas sp.]